MHRVYKTFTDAVPHPRNGTPSLCSIEMMEIVDDDRYHLQMATLHYRGSRESWYRTQNQILATGYRPCADHCEPVHYRAATVLCKVRVTHVPLIHLICAVDMFWTLPIWAQISSNAFVPSCGKTYRLPTQNTTLSKLL